MIITNKLRNIASNTRILSIGVALCLTMILPISLSAKCFSFSNGGDIKVCVNGNNNSARKKAQNACKKAKGSKCGNVTGYAGSCRKGSSTRCINGRGQEKKSLKGS